MRPWRWVTGIGAAFALGACTVGPDFVRPTPPVPTQYVAAADGAVAGDVSATPPAEWWRAYGNPALDALVVDALAHNQTLEVARNTLAQARAIAAQAHGARYPALDLDAAYQHGDSDITRASDRYTVGVNAGFDLDVFGGRRRAEERDLAAAEVARQELAAARLAVAGNVVTAGAALATYGAEIDALNALVADDERNVALVDAKVRAGKAPRLEALTANAQLDADRALLPPLAQQASVARHQLATLSGRYAGDWSPPMFALGDFTHEIAVPIALPAELVHRRPDILAAEARLHAASSALGVAAAALYPQVTLDASVTTEALANGVALGPAGVLWSLANEIALPLAHGGALRAQKKGAAAALRGAAADYREVLIEAFNQVANTLRALAHDDELLAAQSRALASATAARDLARASYAAGKTGILDLLNAERAWQQARLGVARAEGQRLQDSAQLFVAMGGGGRG